MYNVHVHNVYIMDLLYTMYMPLIYNIQNNNLVILHLVWAAYDNNKHYEIRQ